MNPIRNFFESRVLRPFFQKVPTIKQLICSVFGAVLLLYLFLILLSYNPEDPAWSQVGHHVTITNIGGSFGAWVADVLRTFFGLGSWLVLLLLSYELVRVWWARTEVLWPVRMSAYGFLLVLVSACLALVAQFLEVPAVHLGGIVGFELQEALQKSLGLQLTSLFLFALPLLIVFLVLDVQYLDLAKKLLLGKNTNKPAVQAEEIDAQATNQEETADHWSEQVPGVLDLDVQAEDYKDSLESFLVNSGLRQEISILAERERAEQKIHLQARTATVGQHELKLADTPKESPKTQMPKLPKVEPPKPEQTWPEADLVVDTKTQKTEDFVGVDTLHEEDTAIKTMRSSTPEPILSVPQPVRSHAMDTLSYRLSLSPIPELGLLDRPDLSKKPKRSQAQLTEDSELLEIKLQEFGIKATVVDAMIGPVVTRFEVELAPGLKAGRVTRVAQDLARSMSKPSLRVVEVIPGKPYIGIEVPNVEREMVRLIELLDTPDYQDVNKQIAIAVGKDIGGKPVIADLASAPHMLVAGTTGSGKSVLVNSFLLSMLLKYTPDELRLVLIDPKQLELANYGDIPHLLTPVITDMTDAVAALTWCVNEMERRYKLMSKFRVRKISEFNKKIEQAQQAGEDVFDPLWQASDSVSQNKPPKLTTLPVIVIVADEFADMIMQLGKTAEEPIVRLAQKARAAGIHLLLATQRPTVNVVTGLIKANIPARVALRVNSKVDSRTIIEEGGAEDMLGHGDMMFIGPGKNSPERVHGAYVDDNEVNRICDAWRERGSPDYIDLSESYTFEGEGSGDMNDSSSDELYEAAAAFVVETRKASISAVQRKFGIGYNRAARLLDQMEERGLVSAMDHSSKRKVLL